MIMTPKELNDDIERFRLCRLGLYETCWIKETNAINGDKGRLFTYSFDKWFNVYKIFSEL